jgi:hypothetical protein
MLRDLWVTLRARWVLLQFTDAWKRPSEMSSSGPMPVVALREPTDEEAAEAAAKGGAKVGGYLDCAIHPEGG